MTPISSQLAFMSQDDYSEPPHSADNAQDKRSPKTFQNIAPNDTLIPSAGFTSAPRVEINVTAELKMLADIERSYQARQSSQLLFPYDFSYMSTGPLYSLPTLSGTFGSGGLGGGLPHAGHIRGGSGHHH